ncbi:MAG: CHASE domain-containing protein [Elusimicrobia bacterium]|nr:CHASE domain-containing protein [Elusimicrobiota bacterium]
MNLSSPDLPAPRLLGRVEQGLSLAKYLGCGLVTLTVFLTWGVHRWNARERRSEMARALNLGQNLLTESIRACENTALTTRAAFQTHDRLDAGLWSGYINALNLKPDGPINLGYAPFLRAAAPGSRPGGFSPRTPPPSGRREESAPLLFFTSHFGTQRVLSGYDSWADPDRRTAMEKARDSGGVAVTAPLPLKGGVGGVATRGVVFYAAVYRNGPAPSSVAERRKLLRGFIVVALAMPRLRETIKTRAGPLDFALWDTATPPPGSWLVGSPPVKIPGPEFSTTVPAADRSWLLVVTPSGKGDPWFRLPAVWVLVGGFLIAAVGGGLVFGNRRAHTDALQLARTLTLEMRQSVLFLDSVLHEMPSVVYVKDAEKLRFVHVNPAGERLLGISRWEMIGRRNHDCFPPEEADVFESHDRAVVASGRPSETDLEFVTTRMRKRRMLRVRRVPIKDAQGQFRYILCVVEDITEQKYLEAALRQAKNEADAANKAKSVFLAQMSHELRTPLNSVIGFANLLLKNKKENLGPEDLVRLQKIQGNGLHLLELINSILDLSRVEAGRMPVNNAAVDLGRLVTETVEQLRGGLPEGGPVVLRSDLPGPTTPLQTDPGKLKQVLINLIGNAMKFTPQGSVTVRVRAGADGAPSALEVADTGIGIPPDKVGRIFEAFQQVDNGTARKFGGTGLGLTVSRALVDLLGFRMELESEVDRGSVFRVVFQPGPSKPTEAPRG